MNDEKKSFLVEIATPDFNTTRMAVEGGADRIELCSNMAEGGTTPSCGHIKKCREAFSVALYPIIRPRGGDFLYNAEEFEIILQDVILSRELGCDGVVIGLLNQDGSVDINRTSRLVEAAYPMGVTFHRSFDRCRDPFEAMEQLIEAGIERILTSGQKPFAPEGVELIAELAGKAAGRIVIMPGSGVRKDNVRMLAEKTGCTEFHSSLRGKVASEMRFIHPSFAGSAESYENNYLDPREVIELKEALANIE